MYAAKQMACSVYIGVEQILLKPFSFATIVGRQAIFVGGSRRVMALFSLHKHTPVYIQPS